MCRDGGRRTRVLSEEQIRLATLAAIRLGARAAAAGRGRKREREKDEIHKAKRAHARTDALAARCRSGSHDIGQSDYSVRLLHSYHWRKGLGF